jgi:hypothetical protein
MSTQAHAGGPSSDLAVVVADVTFTAAALLLIVLLVTVAAGGAAAVLVVVTVVLCAGEVVVVRSVTVVRVVPGVVGVANVSAARESVCDPVEPHAAAVPHRIRAAIRAKTR